MELLIAIAALVFFAGASVRWGFDSRDSR